jgi:AraC-like DNA-binding protein
MTIQSLASFPAKTAPVGLLASNAMREPANRQCATAAAQPAGSAWRIDFPYMDVVLSISAQPAGATVNDAGFALPATIDAMPSDPVIDRLLVQLGEAEGQSDEDGVHSDAIRLALAARWLRLRSQSETQAQQDANNGALQKWRLKRVMAYIDENIGEAISLADLARTAGLSRMYFAARFRTATGLRPHEYILRRRIERAQDMLAKTNESLVEIAFQRRLPDAGAFHHRLQALRRRHARPLAPVRPAVRLRHSAGAQAGPPERPPRGNLRRAFLQRVALVSKTQRAALLRSLSLSRRTGAPGRSARCRSKAAMRRSGSGGGFPESVGTQAFQSSLSSEPLLVLAALFVIYIIPACSTRATSIR